MRILLDESLPRRLRSVFAEHEVVTVAEAGWSGVENGDLLRLAATYFDVFVTAAQNLQFQQNSSVLKITVAMFGCAEQQAGIAARARCGIAGALGFHFTAQFRALRWLTSRPTGRAATCLPSREHRRGVTVTLNVSRRRCAIAFGGGNEPPAHPSCRS